MSAPRMVLPAKKTLGQLWRQGWHEIPEVMASSFYLVAGLIGAGAYMYLYSKNDWGNHRWKTKYVVYRPNDPRVERVRRFPDSPPVTSVSDWKSGDNTKFC